MQGGQTGIIMRTAVSSTQSVRMEDNLKVGLCGKVLPLRPSKLHFETTLATRQMSDILG